MSDLVFPDHGGDLTVRITQLRDFTEEWLANRRLSEHTRNAYRVDIRIWLAWCSRQGLDPLAVKFTHVNRWARELENPAGYNYRPATAARKLSAVSSWYTFLAKLGVVDSNQASLADRPRVDRDFTATVTFDTEEAWRMVDVAALDDDHLGPVAPVLVIWLLGMGTRAQETCNLNLRNLTHDAGHRVVQMVVKGGKRIQRTVPPEVAEVIDSYLGGRGLAHPDADQLDLPLFVNVYGLRVSRHALTRLIRRIGCRAGLPHGNRISAHGARHAWNTMARAAGAELEDRQRALGHADPRTTMRYDRTARGADSDPSLLVARRVVRQPKPPTQEES